MSSWDMFAAELVDTRQHNRQLATWKRCAYCGARTMAVSGVCTAHDDLIALDETRGPGSPPNSAATVVGCRSPLVSSSAAESKDGPVPVVRGLAAL